MLNFKFLTLLMFLTFMIAGCASPNIGPDFRFKESDDRGLIVVSTRYDSRCGSKSAVTTTYAKVDNSPGKKGNHYGILPLSNMFLKSEFENPPGYLIIKAVPSGKYHFIELDIAGFGAKYNSSGKIGIEFEVNAGQTNYLGELYVKVKNCKTFTFGVNDRWDRDSQMLKKRMKYIKPESVNIRLMSDLSIRKISEYINKKPMSSKTYYMRGVAYGKKGQLDLAIRDFSKVIEISPKVAEAYINRGITYRKKKQFDLAIRDFSKAIQLKPRDAKVYVNRGNSYRYKGQLDFAIRDYDKAIEINPELTAAYYYRGKTYFVGFKNKGKGCADWKKACELGRCKRYERAKRNGDCK